MTRFVLGRLAWMAAILLGVSFVAFMLMRAIPGDFAIAAAGSQSVAPEVLATIRRDLVEKHCVGCHSDFGLKSGQADAEKDASLK